jgi:hypothetical protein
MPTLITAFDRTLISHRPSPSHGRGIVVGSLLCLGLVSEWMAPTANGAGSNQEKIEAARSYEVTGTLSELDLAKGKGMIRTDLGKPIYIEVRKPDLLQSLSVGDRVTIQLKEDGQVDKIMGTPVPELGMTGQPIHEAIPNK